MVTQCPVVKVGNNLYRVKKTVTKVEPKETDKGRMKWSEIFLLFSMGFWLLGIVSVGMFLSRGIEYLELPFILIPVIILFAILSEITKRMERRRGC